MFIWDGINSGFKYTRFNEDQVKVHDDDDNVTTAYTSSRVEWTNK